ncbi:putative cytochrome b5 [Trypanosoma cruzi]|uniref:Cytochrome b5, putative n=3 Tax=Trypanosoma cruzi TaxID=5693 RepID=Q4DQF8_TRYCC|nr:cytochrome b5, putative [Trypanosoma cruzi]EAN94763.1 cytochrome b5, putative [Trypanosoma cruzi]PWV13271.1 putative cytochrome b5 [Trypanosoma cruzi]RNC61080.1 cytochrome b5-like [Trypanosoma cruzi]|eukprot:XP_816614.1 cytochrome b5 [Trypanosoma cruzi strain CL Brener]
MSEARLPKYAWEEIRKHNTDKDCWVVLYGRVLDVTKFLSQHPGGIDPINDLGGYDITNSFESIGHSSRALVLSKEFIVGDLDKDSKPPVVEPKASREDVPLTAYKAGGEMIPLSYILAPVFALMLLFYYYLMA